MTDKQRYQMERWKLLIEDETRNEMKLKDWIRISQMQIELFPNASEDMIREIMRAASHV